MALIPPGGENLLFCEWRLTLSPECPYHEESRLLYLSILIFFGFWSAAILVMIFFRLVVFGKTLYRPLTILWWLRLNALEMLFFAAMWVGLARVIHSSLLLFGESVVPPFLINLFFSLGHSVGAALVTYYWITVIVSLPQDRIVDEFNTLPRLTSFSVKFGFTVSLLYQPLPFLEGISAHFTRSDPRVADALLTTSYVLWPILLTVNQVSIIYFGGKLIKMIEGSIAFHEKSTVVDKSVLTQLKITLLNVKPIVTLSNTIIGMGSGSIFIMCIARYYIWSSKEWSLIFLFLYTYVPMLCSIAFCCYIFFRELYLRLKHGKDYMRTGNSNRESSSVVQRSTLVSSNGKDEEKQSKPPSSRDIGLELVASSKSPDDILDEFIAAR